MPLSLFLTGGHPAVAVADAEAAAELAKEEHELGRTPAKMERRNDEGTKEGCNEKGKQCATIYDTQRRPPVSVMSS